MTNHWNDIENADVVLIMGSNAAENHPISMKFVQKAREKGGKLISVDPRFTRTSAVSDLYAPLRSGTDIAFLNGIINISLQTGKYNKEYIQNYTNATYLIDPAYGFDDGVFSGYDIDKRSYKKDTWKYQVDGAGNPLRDPAMQNPNCVFQLMKKHFERYTVEKVCGITGCPENLLRKVADMYLSTADNDKSATIMYAMGTTQHTVGTQNIRSYVILQLLTANMGVAGGGINALRGESNVQGSTDFGLLFHIVPGYLQSPTNKDKDLAAYLDRVVPKTSDPKSINWWNNTSKYMVSLLKAWWGENAQKDTDGGFAFNYLPKRSGAYDHINLFEAMYAGKIKGLIAWGQNPAVGGPNLQKERKALQKLEWMVVSELWETETAAFWKGPDVDDPTKMIDSRKIDTEVFLLPAVSSIEKDGSISNSGRWVQHRYTTITPEDPGWHGEARSDLWIADAMYKAVKAEYKKNPGKFDDPIMKLNWDYGTGEKIDLHKEPDAILVMSEINGYNIVDGKRAGQVPAFPALKDDGTTASGCWVYAGCCVDWNAKEGSKSDTHFKKIKINGKVKELSLRSAKRIAEKNEPAAMKLIAEGRAPGLNSNWSWAWPVNRRIIYNRASFDANEQPLAPKKWVVKWLPDADNGIDPKTNQPLPKGKYIGDVIDGGATNAPNSKHPFIMLPEGQARLFSSALADGPFPEHYEPVESPVHGNGMSGTKNNPAVVLFNLSKDDVVCKLNDVGAPKDFPIVATTYRMSEHWQAGAMTRNLPWLAELVPDLFVEMSEELAKERKIKHGDKVQVISSKGSIKAYALVTSRFKPFNIVDADGTKKKVHEVGIPWHFGYMGIVTGDSCNILTPHAGDANTNIPEFKAFLCDVKKV
jgi:formate dehydrogenase major subunit